MFGSKIRQLTTEDVVEEICARYAGWDREDFDRSIGSFLLKGQAFHHHSVNKAVKHDRILKSRCRSLAAMYLLAPTYVSVGRDERRLRQEVMAEREYQRQKWGDLDDYNEIADFHLYVNRYLRKAEKKNNPLEPERARIPMLKAATIIVAMLEKFGM